MRHPCAHPLFSLLLAFGISGAAFVHAQAESGESGLLCGQGETRIIFTSHASAASQFAAYIRKSPLCTNETLRPARFVGNYCHVIDRTPCEKDKNYCGTLVVIDSGKPTILKKCEVDLSALADGFDGIAEEVGDGKISGKEAEARMDKLFSNPPKQKIEPRVGSVAGGGEVDKAFTLQEAKDFLVGKKLVTPEKADEILGTGQEAVDTIGCIANPSLCKGVSPEEATQRLAQKLNPELAELVRAIPERKKNLEELAKRIINPSPTDHQGAIFPPAPDSPDTTEVAKRLEAIRRVDPLLQERKVVVARTAYGAAEALGVDPDFMAAYALALQTQECGSCSGVHSKLDPTKNVGPYALSKGFYDEGINPGMSLIQRTDPALHDAAQKKLNEFALSGDDPRSDVLLSSIATVGKHSQYIKAVQEVTKDPLEAAAMASWIHMAPGQVGNALLKDPSSVFTMRLNGDASQNETTLWALGKNGITFEGNENPTGQDAINAIKLKYRKNFEEGFKSANTIRDSLAFAVASTPPPTPFGLSPDPTKDIPDLALLIQGRMFLQYDSPTLRKYGGSPFAGISVAQCLEIEACRASIAECIAYGGGTSVCSTPSGYPTKVGGGGLPNLGGGGGGGSSGGGGGSRGGSSYVPPPPPPPPAPAPTPTPQPTPPPPKAVAVLIAQPTQVSRGGTVNVSWSSVGMNVSSPCQITLEVGTSTAAFASGNEGSKQLGTNASTTPGTQKFTLRCTAQAGEAVEQSATVTVI